MVSTETVGKENLPVIRFHKDSDGLYKMSVLTTADLAQVLNIAKNRKLDETRACLEGNDPIHSQIKIRKIVQLQLDKCHSTHVVRVRASGVKSQG